MKIKQLKTIAAQNTVPVDVSAYCIPKILYRPLNKILSHYYYELKEDHLIPTRSFKSISDKACYLLSYQIRYIPDYILSISIHKLIPNLSLYNEEEKNILDYFG